MEKKSFIKPDHANFFNYKMKSSANLAPTCDLATNAAIFYPFHPPKTNTCL